VLSENSIKLNHYYIVSILHYNINILFWTFLEKYNVVHIIFTLIKYNIRIINHYPSAVDDSLSHSVNFTTVNRRDSALVAAVCRVRIAWCCHRCCHCSGCPYWRLFWKKECLKSRNFMIMTMWSLVVVAAFSLAAVGTRCGRKASQHCLHRCR
jgi:hypothetical protein